MRHPHPPRHAGDRAEPPNEKINHAAEVRARASAPQVYTPPAGFSADPTAWLAELEAAQFTPEQIRFLRSGALGAFEVGLSAARSVPGAEADVVLGDKIIAVWRAWLAANPAPPAGNPFGV